MFNFLMGYGLVRDVKVFLGKIEIVELRKELEEHDIPIYDKKTDCDMAIVLYGAYTNPLIFQNRILAYWVLADNKLYNQAFLSLYLPVLKEYYDELIDLTQCNNYEEMAHIIAKEVKRLQNETD